MKKVIFWVVVIVVVGLWCGLGIPATINSHDTYKGQVSFQTEDSYSQFKQTLIDTNAKWDSGEISVLSSTPPIIVAYIVDVEHNLNFPYGEEKGNGGKVVNIILTSSVIAGLFIIIYYYLFGRVCK